MLNLKDNFENCNSEIFNQIYNLINFMNDILNDTNKTIVKRETKINFINLFLYVVLYNSNSLTTHSINLTKFNIDMGLDLSKNAFTNRLVNIDSEYFKKINDQLISYFYKVFNIDINKIICASDGTSIKLLKSLKEHFKLNQNSLYTTGYVNCIFDVDNKIPLHYNIFKSSNEITNLMEQLKNEKHTYVCVTDRGYEDVKLINFYINKNMTFITRLTKSNKYINFLINNNTNEIVFETVSNNSNHKLKLIKYTTIDKPKITETLDELTILIENNNIIINENKNLLILKKREYKKCSNENKIIIKTLKTFIDKKKEKELNKKLISNRAIKSVIKININVTEVNIDKLITTNKQFINKRDKLIEYEHSDYYILTNNLNYNSDELKKIYKKRWIIETSFKFDKMILNLNQMEKKNINIIKQNIYAIQFITIIQAFINKLLEKYVTKNKHLNTAHVYSCLHEYIFVYIFKCINNNKIINKFEELIKNAKNNKNNKNEIIDKNIKNTMKNEIKDIKELIKKDIFKILLIFRQILKNQISKKETKIQRERIKKRQSNNKFNYRKITRDD